MTMYQPGIPTGLVNIDVDYQNVQDNFQQLDTTYGVDHYAYSNPTSNNGFHNKVTTPGYSTGSPPVTTTNPVFYAYQQYSALGLLQYSRGPNNAVPTPLTNLNSGPTGFSIGPFTSLPILDFTGISLGIVRCQAVYHSIIVAPPSTTQGLALAEFYWDGTSLFFSNIVGSQPANALHWIAIGNVINLQTTLIGSIQDIFWTIEIIRIQ